MKKIKSLFTLAMIPLMSCGELKMFPEEALGSIVGYLNIKELTILSACDKALNEKYPACKEKLLQSILQDMVKLRPYYQNPKFNREDGYYHHKIHEIICDLQKLGSGEEHIYWFSRKVTSPSRCLQLIQLHSHDSETIAQLRTELTHELSFTQTSFNHYIITIAELNKQLDNTLTRLEQQGTKVSTDDLLNRSNLLKQALQDLKLIKQGIHILTYIFHDIQNEVSRQSQPKT